jgi:hypothetical protein
VRFTSKFANSIKGIKRFKTKKLYYALKAQNFVSFEQVAKKFSALTIQRFTGPTNLQIRP